MDWKLTILVLLVLNVGSCSNDSGEEFTEDADIATPFSILSTFPDNDSKDIPTNTSVVVSFSKNLKTSTINSETNKVTLSGNQVSGNWSQNNSLLVWHPSATLISGSSYSVQISENIQDSSGIPLGTAYSWAFTTKLTASTLSLVSVSPVNNATDISVDTKIKAVFNEAISSTSINSSTFKIFDNNTNSVNGTFAVNESTVEFTPSDNFSHFRNYSIKLTTGIQNVAGNALSKADTSTFETKGNVVISTADNNSMVLLSGGRFQMGADNQSIADGTYDADELPSHTVTITGPLLILDHEVTSAEFKLCVDAGGCNYSFTTDTSKYTYEYPGRGNHPMNYVNWNEAVEYAVWLSNNRSGTYRLCTEAEWEYAARAGSTTKWSCGNDTCTTNVAWYSNTGSTKDVKTKLANQWELYDMHGNVREWVSDNHSESYYTQVASGVVDPQGGASPTSGTERGYRGGYYGSDKTDMRSANRDGLTQSTHTATVGFRVCANP